MFRTLDGTDISHLKASTRTQTTVMQRLMASAEPDSEYIAAGKSGNIEFVKTYIGNPNKRDKTPDHTKVMIDAIYASNIEIMQLLAAKAQQPIETRIILFKPETITEMVQAALRDKNTTALIFILQQPAVKQHISATPGFVTEHIINQLRLALAVGKSEIFCAFANILWPAGPKSFPANIIKTNALMNVFAGATHELLVAKYKSIAKAFCRGLKVDEKLLPDPLQGVTANFRYPKLPIEVVNRIFEYAFKPSVKTTNYGSVVRLPISTANIVAVSKPPKTILRFNPNTAQRDKIQEIIDTNNNPTLAGIGKVQSAVTVRSRRLSI